MSTPQDQQPEADHIMVIGPDGQPVAVPAEAASDDAGGDNAERLTGLVEQPAKVMRIGRMVQQLLEEGHMRPHEPAFDPDPTEYVSWEYCRGYADAVLSDG